MDVIVDDEWVVSWSPFRSLTMTHILSRPRTQFILDPLLQRKTEPDYEYQETFMMCWQSRETLCWSSDTDRCKWRTLEVSTETRIHHRYNWAWCWPLTMMPLFGNIHDAHIFIYISTAHTILLWYWSPALVQSIYPRPFRMKKEVMHANICFPNQHPISSKSNWVFSCSIEFWMHFEHNRRRNDGFHSNNMKALTIYNSAIDALFEIHKIHKIQFNVLLLSNLWKQLNCFNKQFIVLWKASRPFG